mmetsp:Transcript_11280/g.14222  ORF Transcript_11280/g.14222 Transcript_11280/m.14222 type:complete len:238 (+) Transcript_11280:691-1404(+)
MEVGLHVGDVDLAVSLANNLRTSNYLGSLDRVLVARDIARSLRSCKHDLANFMGRICGLDSLKLRLLDGAKRELRAVLSVRERVILWVIHFVLLLEAARGVTALLRTDTHTVQLGLFGGHVAAVSLELGHGSLCTAVESGRGGGRGALVRTLVVCNLDARLLRGCQLLNEASGGARGGLRRGPLIGCRHGLDHEVFIIVVSPNLHLDRLELFLKTTLLDVGHEGGHLGLARLHRVCC